MDVDTQRQLKEAREAAGVLAGLQDKAASLPGLEQQAQREQQVKSATARLARAVELHTATTAEAQARMAGYRERLGPVLEELDALALVLAEVGAGMRDAVLRVDSAVHELAVVQREITGGQYEKVRQAHADAYACESILDGLDLAPLAGLGPWVQDPGVNALVRLIVDRVAARGGVVFDPAYPVHS